MRNLFNEQIIPGLDTWPNILTQDEISRLEHRVKSMDIAHYQHGEWEANRQVAHYSCPSHPAYACHARHDIEPWMLGVRNRIVKAAGRPPQDFIQFSVSVYPPGAGIGWHRDMPPFTRIIGVSIGHPTYMRFRQKDQHNKWRRRQIPLDPGTVYAITGPARSEWEHSIAPVTHWRASFTTRDVQP